MKIPFVNLKRQIREIKNEIAKEIEDVFRNSNFIQGENVKAFEREFADYVKVPYSVSVNSGTDALILGIRALDLPPASEVIVAANTFIAAPIAIVENQLGCSSLLSRRMTVKIVPVLPPLLNRPSRY